MKSFLLFFALLYATVTATMAADSKSPVKPYGLVLHGGAGVIERKGMSPEREAEYRATLTAARGAGYAVLERGGSALVAVIAVIVMLENSPLFNAGKGAVFTADGTCELDASIMDGRTQAAGAVAGLRRIKNPITLARAVMDKSKHVMLSGDGAERFAQQEGFTFVPNEYFHTEHRRQQLERAKQLETGKKSAGLSEEDADFERSTRYGTVGCAALDRNGNLAAGTSTGGMTNKKFGRIGDAPIIGAGTYASNATCAISATGWGEFFIRLVVAKSVSDIMEYKNATLKEAAEEMILKKVPQLGGDG